MICDFIMMIKYLNEGKDYDTYFIIDCMKEVLNGNVTNLLNEREMSNRDTRLVKGKVIIKGNDIRKVNVAFRKGVFVCCKYEANVKEIEMCVYVDKETMRCDVERKGKEFMVMIRKATCDKEFVVIRRTEYMKGVIMYEECKEMCVCVDDEGIVNEIVNYYK
jgi:Fe-S cluster assembly ATPase SufC